MNQKMRAVALATVAVLCSGSYMLRAQTAEELFSQGRDFLRSFNQEPHDANDLLDADASFQAALATDPDHRAAAIFGGVTRFAVLFYDADVNALATAFGVSEFGRDLWDFTAVGPDPMLPDSPTSGESLALATEKLLPAIDTTLASLERFPGNWPDSITIETNDVPIDEAVEVDLGDVLMFRALLHAARFKLYFLKAYDFDVDIDSFEGIEEISIENHLLTPYPTLGTVSNAPALTESSNSLANAIDTYMLASASIRSETDDQSDDLLSFDPEDLTEEAEARNWLGKAKTSLETPVQVTTNGFDHPVYLGALFEPPYIDRTYLPDFLADNEVVLNSFPDPTFSGLLPDFTQDHLFADTLPPHNPASMAPSGGAALVDRTPLLTWSDPLLNASWFQVVVSGPNGTILNRWLEDAQVQMAHLGPGNYSWWVRSWNEHGYSGWSGAAKFSIVLSPPPSPPTVLGPIGQQPLGDRRPQFSWEAVGGAAWYRVWVSRVGKGFYVERWVQAPATDWPADRDFAGGDYRWWIVAWNPDGYGPWSGGTDFAIPLLKPGKIVLNSPTGGMDLAGGNVTYEWEADERATWYRLWSAKDGKAVVDRWYAAGDVVSGATASADIGGHRWGKYTWYACGWGADGLGTWSDGGTFTCGRPTPLSGSATALVWDDTCTMTADWYHFWLQNTDNGTATSFWLQRGNTTDAGGGQRSIVINPQLTPANYAWYIRAWNKTDGTGPWSEGRAFTVL